MRPYTIDSPHKRDHRPPRLKRWATGLSCFFAGQVLVLSIFLSAPMVAASGQVMRAQSFIVVDENGRERGYFGVDEETQTAAIAVCDAERKMRISLSARPGECALIARDADGTLRIDFRCTPQGMTYLTFVSAEGKGAVNMYASGINPGILLRSGRAKVFQAPR